MTITQIIRSAMAGGALFAACAVGGSVSATQSNEAICIMDFDSYCSLYEGHVVNTPAYRECYVRWRDANRPGGFCEEGVG